MSLRLVAALAIVLALAVPVAAQERACSDERDTLRILVRQEAESWLSVQAQLAEAVVREQRLRQEIEAMKAAAKKLEEPKK